MSHGIVVSALELKPEVSGSNFQVGVMQNMAVTNVHDFDKAFIYICHSTPMSKWVPGNNFPGIASQFAMYFQPFATHRY